MAEMAYLHRTQSNHPFHHLFGRDVMCLPSEAYITGANHNRFAILLTSDSDMTGNHIGGIYDRMATPCKFGIGRDFKTDTPD